MIRKLYAIAFAVLLFAALLLSGCSLLPNASGDAVNTPQIENEATQAPQIENEATQTPETESAPPASEAPEATDAGKVYNALFGEFTTLDLDGNAIDQTVFEGHEVTMVNIWATFCSPCLGEMPELGELAAEYADKGVQIVGIVIDVTDGAGNAYEGGIDYAKSLVESTGASYLHLLPSQALTDAYLGTVQSFPTTVFIDEHGAQLGKEYIGSRDKAAWAGVIDDMLKLSSAENAV